MVIQMKKLFVFILIISLLSSVTAFADDEEFTSVSDGASMLSEATERYIYTQNKILDKKSGARIIIVTATDSGELTITEYADKLYEELQAKGVEVIYDDRNVSAGVMFSDADLLGVPIRVIVSPRNLKQDVLEVTSRDKTLSEKISVEGAAEQIMKIVSEF